MRNRRAAQPMLLNHVSLQVTASTSVLMILFSSSAISISLSFQGYLNVSYALIFAPLAFVSSILGCAPTPLPSNA